MWQVVLITSDVLSYTFAHFSFFSCGRQSSWWLMLNFESELAALKCLIIFICCPTISKAVLCTNPLIIFVCTWALRVMFIIIFPLLYMDWLKSLSWWCNNTALSSSNPDDWLKNRFSSARVQRMASLPSPGDSNDLRVTLFGKVYHFKGIL